jgi:hypothetical protein
VPAKKPKKKKKAPRAKKIFIVKKDRKAAPIPADAYPKYVFGRPTIYDPKFCQMLIDHMAQGFSFESFGALIMSHKQTLYEWAEKHSDFGDAKKVGTELSRLRWEREGINGHMMGKDFNATSYIFQVKGRFRDEWGDHVKVEKVDPKNLEGFKQLEPDFEQPKKDKKEG